MNFNSQVSTHVVLDHQTNSAQAQHTQITWTDQVKCDEHYNRVPPKPPLVMTKLLPHIFLFHLAQFLKKISEC